MRNMIVKPSKKHCYFKKWRMVSQISVKISRLNSNTLSPSSTNVLSKNQNFYDKYWIVK